MSENLQIEEPVGGWREPWPLVFEIAGVVRALDEHPLVMAQAPSDTATLARRTLDDLRDGGL